MRTKDVRDRSNIPATQSPPSIEQEHTGKIGSSAIGDGKLTGQTQADAAAPGFKKEQKSAAKPGQQLGDVRARLAKGEKFGGAEKLHALSSEALQAALAEHATAQWFTGKNRPIEHAQVTAAAPIAGDAASGQSFFSLIDLRYKDGGGDVFQVPLWLGPDGAVSDALQQPGYVRSIVGAMRDGAKIRTTHGTLKASATLGSEAYFPDDLTSTAVKKLKGPQSNHSYKVGEGLIYKAYAKPEPDVSIEREMTAHLTAQGYTATPRLVGTLSLQADRELTVGLLFEFAKNDGDGWGWLTEAIKAGKAGEKEVLDRLELLGKRIGEMHVALGAETDDPAFAPQQITGQDLGAWAEILKKELDQTIEKAIAQNPELGAKLEAARDALEDKIAQLGSIDPSGFRTRIHGDLHLGQVLVREGDWMVLDFEGEPARSKAERREKYTPLRDVAGMLRSFAYAQADAEKASVEISTNWSAEASARFLAGYSAAISQTGLMPKNETTFQTILAASELEKAMYEVRYELTSRPDWVDIPAKRLFEIAAQ